MSQTPISPRPPDADPAPSPLNQESWQGYSPSHYVHVRRGPPLVVKLGAALVVLAALAGAGWLMKMRVSSGDVLSEIERTLAAAKCPAHEGQLSLHVLVLEQGAEAYVQGDDASVTGCYERAVGAGRFGTHQEDVVVTAQVLIEMGPKGAQLAPYPQALQKQTLEWRTGILGESLGRKRGRVGRLLEANFAEMAGCYLDGAARWQRRVQHLPWHAKDEVGIRARIAPDGSVVAVTVSRPGSGSRPRDWTLSQNFQACIIDLVSRMPWPAHSGATWEWVNTSVRLTPSQL